MRHDHHHSEVPRVKRVEVGIAVRALGGEDVCGDAARVFRDGDRVLVAIADGMGHGPGAAHAAGLFCDFAAQRVNLDVAEILRGAHGALRGSRGAVAALLQVHSDTGEVAFAGLGNITIKPMTQQPVTAFSMPGAVGAYVRKIRAFRGQLDDGDTLVMHSDGIRNVVLFDGVRTLGVVDLAEVLLDRYSTGRDDASCAVLRYRR
jgi:negative regulator of sigma-B (phosphoserine phosphatase)